jgi:phage repressor protein C with HTH and peptisase S24 domain
LPVSAGTVAELLQEEERPTGFISMPGVSCKAYFPVVGCSYEPIIRAGDIIGIDFIDRWERLDPDCLYYILTHEQRMIKRLKDDLNNPDRLICISPNFGDFPIWKEEIKAIHKVVFYGRLV